MARRKRGQPSSAAIRFVAFFVFVSVLYSSLSSVYSRLTEISPNGLLWPVIGLVILLLALFFFLKNKKARVYHTAPVSQPSPAPSAAASSESSPNVITISIPDTIDGKPVAYQYEDVDIYTPDDDVFQSSVFSVGTKLNVVSDAENPHDPNAVALTNLNGLRVGYLYRGKLQDMANDWIKRKLPIYAVIGGWDREAKKAQIGLFFYDVSRFEKLIARHPDAKAYKLTANANAEMQENIGLCSRGDECEISFDIDKEKYLVSAGLDIGYLPVSAAKIAESVGEENCEVYVAETGYSDSGKETVSVYIFTE